MPFQLLISVDCTEHIHLIVGDNGAAAKRVNRSLEAGANCVLISPIDFEGLHYDLKAFIQKERIKHVQRDFQDDDLKLFGRPEVDGVVDMVFVTLSPLDKRGQSGPTYLSDNQSCGFLHCAAA